MNDEPDWEEPCPAADQEPAIAKGLEFAGHCNHWYDGEACCWCGAAEMTDDEREEAGCEL